VNNSTRLETRQCGKGVWCRGCTDTSDPRHFGTGAEVSIGYFGTTVVSACRSVLDISAPLILRTQKCQIYLKTIIYWWLASHFGTFHILHL